MADMFAVDGLSHKVVPSAINTEYFKHTLSCPDDRLDVQHHITRSAHCITNIEAKIATTINKSSMYTFIFTTPEFSFPQDQRRHPHTRQRLRCNAGKHPCHTHRKDRSLSDRVARLSAPMFRSRQSLQLQVSLKFPFVCVGAAIIATPNTKAKNFFI